MKLPKWLIRLAPKPERMEQIVYNTTYVGICPICKDTSVESDGHCTDSLNKYAHLDDTKLVECPKCHAAFYAQNTGIVKTRKTYERTGDSVCDLKVVKEEAIP